MALKLIRFIFLLMMAIVTAKVQNDPAANQIITFKNKTCGPIAIMTTGTGAPVERKDTVTLNKRLIFNEFLMESMTHLVRERIPPRVVHAKGAGAFGYFEVTHDVTDICKANFLNKVGKKTPVALRFSNVFQERGGIDTPREPRGFSVKFYTQEGNFDIVGFDTPMFVFKDPILFTSFVRANKKNPATNLMDPNMLWDYITLNPESTHIFMLIFSDRGIPDGYRHMPGFGIHTYQVVNENGESCFTRFHFYPDSGVKNLSSEEAKKIAADNPDYGTKDLYNAIARGDFPSWTASIQVLSWDDVQNAGINVFDVTKVLPSDKYPLRPLGRLVLNRNPVNYFAEIEQLAFCPGNLVPGIPGAPDKIFESRRLAYRDSQYHRLGANFLKIAVNCPMRATFTYNRDGAPPVRDNMRDVPNYYPNSFNGPVPYTDKHEVELVEIYEDPPNNLDQAREVYVNEMTDGERKRLVENILSTLRLVAKFLQERAVKLFSLVHPDLGRPRQFKPRERLSASDTKGLGTISVLLPQSNFLLRDVVIEREDALNKAVTALKPLPSMMVTRYGGTIGAGVSSSISTLTLELVLRIQWGDIPVSGFSIRPGIGLKESVIIRDDSFRTVVSLA